jgi:nucleoside 2-deoxyribosyltransferase/SAM-dependent methyltransferase
MRPLNHHRLRIYWANALFGEADREFNARCATKLRAAGFTVFLPQEANVNTDTSPTAPDIFRLDTREILRSNLMIVCLDQETIDCGVACEIGLAFAYGIPMLGFYTDIRQFRSGSGRMYKNLYVIGAVLFSGKIVASIEDLLRELQALYPEGQQTLQHPCKRAAEHYENISPAAYESLVRDLETWYSPFWSVNPIVNRWVETVAARHVIELGCAFGALGSHLCERFPSLSYFGFDQSRTMINAAQTRCQNERFHCTSEMSELLEVMHEGSTDLALALFTLHDHPSKSLTLATLARLTRPGGLIGIVDLSTHDLPLLTDGLRRFLARPAICADPRIDVSWMRAASQDVGLTIVECSPVLLQVRFPAAEALSRYLRVFGISRGLDFPLDLDKLDDGYLEEQLDDWLASLQYPFVDERVFFICGLKKM